MPLIEHSRRHALPAAPYATPAFDSAEAARRQLFDCSYCHAEAALCRHDIDTLKLLSLMLFTYDFHFAATSTH